MEKEEWKQRIEWCPACRGQRIVKDDGACGSCGRIIDLRTWQEAKRHEQAAMVRT